MAHFQGMSKMAKKKERKYYVVEGSGMFPYDMLRYDHSWPHSETYDSHKLAEDYGSGMRRVMLASDQQGTCPNLDRWKSFTWKVIAVGPEATHISQWRDDKNKPSMFADMERN